jgi:hypothetical protein
MLNSAMHLLSQADAANATFYDHRYQKPLAQIDIRRFITFGLIHGFICRVHRYPVFIDRNQRSSTLPPVLSTSPSSMNTAATLVTSTNNLPPRMPKATLLQHGENAKLIFFFVNKTKV